MPHILRRKLGRSTKEANKQTKGRTENQTFNDSRMPYPLGNPFCKLELRPNALFDSFRKIVYNRQPVLSEKIDLIVIT